MTTMQLDRQRTAPSVAIVTPVYRHSALVFEAVASFLDQPGCERSHLVVVDDGCPSTQTSFDLCGLPASYPNIHYIRHSNKGLSGARNRGIAFVLDQLPDTEAVFFLDADNRLAPGALPTFQRVLANSDADWFYPDIEMFGLEWFGDYSGPFRRLEEVFHNICEAGSLVRRRVFDAGVRFDEKMLLGFEDWEFWQAAIELGFKGEHVRNLGLRYRQRAESMLASSNRHSTEIIAYMEKKHRWAADLDVLLTLEHAEAPRYAIYLEDVGRVHLTSDPARAGQVLSIEDYRDKFERSLSRPQAHAVGAFFVVTTEPALAALREARLINLVLWNIEQDLLTNKFSILRIVDGEMERVSFTQQDTVDPTVHLAATSVDLLRTVGRGGPAALSPLDGLDSVAGTMTAHALTLPAGMDVPRPGQAHKALVSFCSTQARESAVVFAPGERHLGTRDAADLATAIRSRYAGRPVPNWFGVGEPRVAIVLPLVEYGGVEKVALALSRELRRAGFGVDLFVLGPTSAVLPKHVLQLFDRAFLLSRFGFGDFSGPEYQGTALPRAGYPRATDDLTNLLSGYQAVIGSHAADLLGSFAQLRKAGVVTINHLHLIEHTWTERSVGHCMLGLAYEHAVDLFLTCSDRLAAELGMLGVPREKILAVPNAPSLDRPESDNTSDRRLRAEEQQPLRVIYLGRLDYQKGVDRLGSIFRTLRSEPDRFELAVVGSRIVDGSGTIATDLYDVLRPAAHADEDLAALYCWADMIVLPSRYEGVPLTILEAQLFGVVPIATRVGAVEEAIEDGYDGFLVDEEHAVEEMVQRIRTFADQREDLLAISDRAVARRRQANWAANAAPFLSRLEVMISARRQGGNTPSWVAELGTSLDRKALPVVARPAPSL